VAAREIPVRTIIEPGMVMSRTMPAADIPKGAMLMKDAVDKVALVTIAAGAPIVARDVVPRDASLGLSYRIPPSMRAVTVAVNPVIGVGGFLKPGTMWMSSQLSPALSWKE